MTIIGTKTNRCAFRKTLSPPVARYHSTRMTKAAMMKPPVGVASHSAALSSPNAEQMGCRPR